MARHEGPGGCVPWEEHEQLRERIRELVADYTHPEHWEAAQELAAVPLERIEALLND